MIQRALIYCRVSTKKQTREGSGLISQENRCRKHALERSYTVDAVFPDDVSGGGDFMQRPGMVALLRHLKAHPETEYVVIFDDLKRFARDTEAHLALRREFRLYGASVECLNYNFDESPEGKFVETVFAAQGELEKEQNKRQSRQKTVARLESGYWALRAPWGYKMVEQKPHGKLLTRDEPLASIIQEALENFANGRFQTQGEVKMYLESRPEFPKGRDGKVHFQRVKHLLTRKVYAGIIDVEKYGIFNVQGEHEPLISLETFNKIQNRLVSTAKAPVKKNLNLFFPLRGAVNCSSCNKPLTAGRSTSKTGRKYPYYLCCRKECEAYGLSIKSNAIEEEFVALLKQLVPSKLQIQHAKKMFTAIWNSRRDYQKNLGKSLEEHCKKLELDIEKLIDRIVDLESPRVVRSIEKRIKNLELEKAISEEKMEKIAEPVSTFEETFRTSLAFLVNPLNLWASERYEDKRTVLRLAFSGNLTYDRIEGFRTPPISRAFSLLGGFKGG